MRQVSISMFAFGIYMAVIGLILLIAPEIILNMLGSTTPPGLGWRMFGMILLYLAYYYFRSSLQDNIEMDQFFLWTAQARSTVIIVFIIFVLTGVANWIILLIGLIDLAGALWTLWTLRKGKT